MGSHRYMYDIYTQFSHIKTQQDFSDGIVYYVISLTMKAVLTYK